MPPSAVDTQSESPPGTTLAVAAESLYLVNLMLLPGLAFLVLLVLFFKHQRGTPPLALSHLEQTFSASLWGGILLVVVNAFIILFGGYEGPNTWVIVILYFTICHSCLILLGMLGLAKALSGKCFRYPLIGRTLPDGCRGML
jgi:uncharacterized membrane protein